MSLDMCEMNRILWIDPKNLLCRAEAGVIGIDLEEQVCFFDRQITDLTYIHALMAAGDQPKFYVERFSPSKNS